MRGAGLLLAMMLPACGSAWAQSDYQWMGGSGDGNYSLSYGTPETDDQPFWLVCRNGDRKTELVVYVEIKDVKLGQPVAIEFASRSAKATIKGEVSTDEMSGFFFTKAEQFPIKPVLDLLAAKRPVTVKTGTVVTELSDKGRGPEVAKFAKGCELN